MDQGKNSREIDLLDGCGDVQAGADVGTAGGVGAGIDPLLESRAVSLFGNSELKKIIDWYSFLLGYTGKYIVFLVRRSYVLALLMEKITGWKLNGAKVGKDRIMTDASFYLQCPALAEYFREYHCFPEILICDDILIHGRNLNHFLALLEDRLMELMPEYEDEIVPALAKAVRIHVYMHAEKALLLYGQYRQRLMQGELTPGRRWHEYSNNISTLIQCSDVPNAVYVYTEDLAAEMLQTINLSQYIATDFQYAREYTKVRFVRTGGKIKAAFTLRIIRNLEAEQYQVIPFVFLPNLDADETEVLLKVIDRKLEGHQELRKWLTALRNIPGKRVLNELITYIFSDALLQEFNDHYGVFVNPIREKYEYEKLARNYNTYGMESTERLLKELRNLRLFTSEELESLINMVASEERFLAEADYISEDVTSAEIESIKGRVEDYFYEQGYREEQSAVALSNEFFYPREKGAERRVRGVCFALQELLYGLSVKQMEYCIAFVLQLADAGAISLSSYAPKNMLVVGFAQFAKAGEQALLLYPLKVYDYMPMLAAFQRKCRQQDWDMKEKLGSLLHSRYWVSPEGKDPDTEERELVGFLDTIEKINQMPEDWNGNYLARKCSNVREGIECRERRDRCLKAFEDYFNNI